MVLPSGKHTKNYGNSPFSSWVNPLFRLFLWPFSMSQTVRHYQRLPYFTPFSRRHGSTDLRQLDGVHSDAVHQETSNASLSAVGWLWGFGISNMGMV